MEKRIESAKKLRKQRKEQLAKAKVDKELKERAEYERLAKVYGDK